MSEVTELLAGLRSGALGLDEVVARFRQRSWPAPPPPDCRTMADPAETTPGSFEEVVLAYARRDITDEQYAALLEAASSAGRPEQDHPGR